MLWGLLRNFSWKVVSFDTMNSVGYNANEPRDILAFLLVKMKEEGVCYAFIDAANLFYGGEKSLGFKIDYLKLKRYLAEKYSVSRWLYFGGIEVHKYIYDYERMLSVPLGKLEKYLIQQLPNEVISNQLQRLRFYKKLEQFGYELHLKPVKEFRESGTVVKKKANCDVDMAFWLMKEQGRFDSAVILSGDGDFLPVLCFLKEIGKRVDILSRGQRTAREIRQFAGGNFRDFGSLRQTIEFR